MAPKKVSPESICLGCSKKFTTKDACVEDSKSANYIERNPGDELLTRVSRILTC